MRGRLPAAGSYTGTAAVLEVKCGFRPKAVLLLNSTDGDVVAIHIDGMTADTDILISTASVGNAADGITLTPTGFKVGTDYSESAKVFFYIAF